MLQTLITDTVWPVPIYRNRLAPIQSAGWTGCGSESVARSILTVKGELGNDKVHDVYAETTHIVVAATWISMYGHTCDKAMYSVSHRNLLSDFGATWGWNLALLFTLSIGFFSSLYHYTRLLWLAGELTACVDITYGVCVCERCIRWCLPRKTLSSTWPSWL